MLTAKNHERVAELAEKELEMPLVELARVFGVQEPMPCVLAHRLEQTIPCTAPRISFEDNEGLVDEPTQMIQHLARINTIASAHAFGGFQRPRRREYAQPIEEESFDVRQKLVAPIHCRFECPLARYRRACAAGEQTESVVQSRLDLLRRQDGNARRSQLDRQRNSIQASANTAMEDTLSLVTLNAGSAAVARSMKSVWHRKR